MLNTNILNCPVSAIMLGFDIERKNQWPIVSQNII